MRLRPVFSAAAVALLLGACATSTPPPAKTVAPAPAPTPVPTPTPPPYSGVSDLEAAKTALAVPDHAKARPLLEKAVQDPATRVEAGMLLAQSHLEDDGDAAAAIAAVKPVVEQEATNTKALVLLARAHELAAQRQDAANRYKRALELDGALLEPKERLAALALAEMVEAAAANNADLMRDAAARALESFRAAKTQAGDKAMYALGESQAYEAVGNLAAAEAALKRLQVISPDAPGPHLMLAAYYDRHGDKKKAAAERAKGGQAPEPARKLRPLKPAR